MLVLLLLLARVRAQHALHKEISQSRLLLPVIQDVLPKARQHVVEEMLGIVSAKQAGITLAVFVAVLDLMFVT